ncbi:MAG: polyhydroxyalkanoate depolymerase [Alphaproteobacteria bacterium]
MWYHVFELNRAAVQPMRWVAKASSEAFRSPFNPVTYTHAGRTVAAACHVFDRLTRRYGKPEFGLTETKVNGVPVEITEEIVWRSPWCQLKRFKRDPELLKALKGARAEHEDPPVLIVAPMSGHYATLLRGTVEAMLPAHDVYITDWADARHVPIIEGRFDLNDYIDTLLSILRGPLPNAHIVAVCQPGPASLAATALMAQAEDPAAPLSLTIMGSPIDARESPTEPNRVAMAHSLDWFRKNAVSSVPWPYPGAFREVYPGFLQLHSFISMNRARHVEAHTDYFDDLVKGDGESAAKHREFYDEYLAVMDLTAEFYLQTIDAVFQRHLLPKGEFEHRGQLVRLPAIRNTAVLTVEGEHDDISGIGQTQAVHDLLTGLPASMRADHVQPGVGHYGVFNGSRFRKEIQPRMAEFIRAHDRPRSAKVVPFRKTA